MFVSRMQAGGGVLTRSLWQPAMGRLWLLLYADALFQRLAMVLDMVKGARQALALMCPIQCYYCRICRRWNNTTGLTLRALVYDPIVEGSLMGRAALEARKPSPKPSQKSPNKPPQKPYRPPMWLKLFGMCATFAVSGVMHEILLYMLAPEGQYHVGYWFTFFFIQAPIMFAEGLVLRALHNRKIYIPRTLAIPLTTATVLTTAWYFWYPPIENHTDIANEAVASINANVGALIAWGQGLCEQWDLKQGLESQMATLGQMWPGIRAYVAESATSP
eukprot:GHUV01021803.1.p1 GENE.GHUV01021803.1~~GHUV01021803.1.p1  ORF type:complete len:275 (+),score=37.85 GHUV01021803.1:1031-1855(+)